MSAVAIVTDTTTYVPDELLDELGVAQVSLYVGWEGDLQPESSYTDLGAFYARLRDSDTLPTTSQPSVGDFNAVYEPLLAAGREVVSIHLARSLSGTCASAEESAAAHEGVTVVDGRTGSGGLGLVVIAAARAAAAGATVPEVIETIDRTRERLAMWFA